MKKIIVLMLFISVVACRKPYTPPAIAAASSYLVVEGLISNSIDSVVIKLSRTVNLSNISTKNPVTGASVTIENDQNAVYPLFETSAGNYYSSGLTLDSTRKYRLRISIGNNKQYLSDFVPVINSPPIDSVTFSVQSNGINIFTNTHDPSNNTRYYRWDYRETWIFHSNYYSYYKSNGDSVIERNMPADQVYECWRSDTSGVILLGTSAHLSKDVISNSPITFVDPATGKLGGKHGIVNTQSAPSSNSYSILVRQYGLTGDAFTFWTNLKSNTEQLGSIFSNQPSQIAGNIHSVSSPSEPVVGFISAGRVTNKRMFIPNQAIPDKMAITLNPECVVDTFYLSALPPGGVVPINQENEYFNYDTGAQYGGVLYEPIAVIYDPIFGVVIGHTGSTAQCVDCSLFGTSKQPAFWR